MFTESALLIVGDELLSGRTQDVNLRKFSGVLAEKGFPVVEARVVRDVSREITAAVKDLTLPERILLVTGGMGPTDDDLTAAAVADALGLQLVRSSEAEAMVRSRQELYGLGLPLSALKQAEIPEGAIPVLNEAGIAPGFVVFSGECAVICMPGVPSESEALILPCLEAAGAVQGKVEPVYFIRTWGLKENALFDKLRETAKRNHVVPAFLPSPGRVDIKVRGEGAEGFSEEVCRMLGSSVYSTKRDQTLEEVLGSELLKRGFTLATAESCTGGGISRGITEVPGASNWYTGGVVSYADSVKRDLLGVKEETLARFGAVSGETAMEMAIGVMAVTGADCAVAVTGIAGPGGGTPDKPVGTVWTAAVVPGRRRQDIWRLGGNRESIRQGASSRALGTVLELLR